MMQESTVCRRVSPVMSHAWANGVLLVDHGKTLLVNDIVYGTTIVYDVHPVSKKLRRIKTIVSPGAQEAPVETLTNWKPIGATPDNLSLVPGSEDVLVSGMCSRVHTQHEKAVSWLLTSFFSA